MLGIKPQLSEAAIQVRKITRRMNPAQVHVANDTQAILGS
jgi:hypothetical protein